MQSAEEKLKNVASSAKDQDLGNKAKAKLEEKVEKAASRTSEEKEMVHEQRKARMAKAKMELHQARAKHTAEKFAAKHCALAGHSMSQRLTTRQPSRWLEPQPVGSADTMTGTTVPTYPLGGHRPH